LRIALLASALAAVLAACAQVDMTALRALKAEGDGFAPRLARAYRTLALEWDDAGADWRDVARFGNKALRLADGWIEPPDDVPAGTLVRIDASEIDEGHRDIALEPLGMVRPPAPRVRFEGDERGIAAELRPVLAAARTGLIEVLARGARHTHAPEAAEAQIRFDCWVAQAMADRRSDARHTCRAPFETALADLRRRLTGQPFRAARADVPAAPACTAELVGRRYTVFADFDNLDPEAAEVLDRAALEATLHKVCVERRAPY
jgi:hypothetical protein